MWGIFNVIVCPFSAGYSGLMKLKEIRKYKSNKFLWLQNCKRNYNIISLSSPKIIVILFFWTMAVNFSLLLFFIIFYVWTVAAAL